MTEPSFKSQLAMLAKYYRYTLAPDYVGMYWNMLKHLTDDELTLAVTNCIKEFVPTAAVPFPLVAHFLRYCGQAGDVQARNAISILKRAIGRVGQYESVAFNDPALHYAVMSFGGWPAVCRWTAKEWDVNEKRLEDTYKAASTVRVREEGHLPGLSERDGGVYRIYQISHNGTMAIAQRIQPRQVTDRREVEVEELASSEDVQRICSEVCKILKTGATSN